MIFKEHQEGRLITNILKIYGENLVSKVTPGLHIFYTNLNHCDV
jgi:hypothetical protein